MGLLPHPTLPVGDIRTTDVMTLLALGIVWEFVARLISLSYKRKSSTTRQQELSIQGLQRQVKKSRDLGPSAFVETSKLERQLLATEKALADAATERQAKLDKWKGQAKTLDTIMVVIIVVLWWGVPVLEFSPYHPSIVETLTADAASTGHLVSQEEAADWVVAMMQGFLFPLSYVGVGVRISKWGLPNPKASIGALLVFWSAQTFVGQIMDGVEALILLP